MSIANELRILEELKELKEAAARIIATGEAMKAAEALERVKQEREDKITDLLNEILTKLTMYLGP